MTGASNQRGNCLSAEQVGNLGFRGGGRHDSLSLMADSETARVGRHEPESDAEKPAEHHCVYCPNCSERLAEHRCKLVCRRCGYYLSCADYY